MMNSAVSTYLNLIQLEAGGVSERDASNADEVRLRGVTALQKKNSPKPLASSNPQKNNTEHTSSLPSHPAHTTSPKFNSVPQHPNPFFAPPSTSPGRILLYLSNKPMENSCNSWLSSSIISRKSPVLLNRMQARIFRQCAVASSPRTGCVSVALRYCSVSGFSCFFVQMLECIRQG